MIKYTATIIRNFIGKKKPEYSLGRWLTSMNIDKKEELQTRLHDYANHDHCGGELCSKIPIQRRIV